MQGQGGSRSGRRADVVRPCELDAARIAWKRGRTEPDPPASASAMLSKGTYVRTLAHDLGDRV
ncbi:MAG: hypothetical protein MZU79_05815 [Anaerotruncus sp.]|nr:hypothetical protein [Anaerotruncus sp.]